MSGYYLYVRRTTGSTLLGVMHLSRSSIGIFNSFTAEVPFYHQVTAAVMEPPYGPKYYGYRGSMLPGSSFTTSHIYTNGHTPESVYGYMMFVDYE